MFLVSHLMTSLARIVYNHLADCRLLAECGDGWALSLCQYVDGKKFIPSCGFHYGHICKSLCFTGSHLAYIFNLWCHKLYSYIVITVYKTYFQTLSVSMLLRYSHHQIFVFIGKDNYFSSLGIVNALSYLEKYLTVWCNLQWICYKCWRWTQP